ncbi:FAD:protein FMN transferase [Aquirhabdus parva]|uniref:FAD:protein FMN transferase n=1 Tax=Aquirhabdus parva TaxID=2283318 RepID=A0A345P8Z4_9GAMM|nr:FAD:protein FMN transferase [Aquirhabdus parva]AXI03753.1 FAD:protein FMN transferase [Aquirhabdus parva]
MLSPLSNSLQRARPLLGTFVEIKITGDQSLSSDAMAAAFSTIEHVQNIMSFHDPGSDVGRINAANAGILVTVAPETYDVLQFANQLSTLSGGAFDITVADVLVRSGFLPEHSDASPPPFRGSYQDLVLRENHSVCWLRKGWIDLGGIAKGYAIDAAITSLKQWGIKDAVVNAGGDLRCIGSSQRIHVRHPEDDMTLIALGSLTDAAIATSAGYFSSQIEDQREINPIVDPHTRRCAAWNQSISVIASNCMTADALTKVVRLLPEGCHELLRHFNAQAISITPQGMMTCGTTRLNEDIHEY